MARGTTIHDEGPFFWGFLKVPGQYRESLSRMDVFSIQGTCKGVEVSGMWGPSNDENVSERLLGATVARHSLADVSAPQVSLDLLGRILEGSLAEARGLMRKIWVHLLTTSHDQKPKWWLMSGITPQPP